MMERLTQELIDGATAIIAEVEELNGMASSMSGGMHSSLSPPGAPLMDP